MKIKSLVKMVTVLVLLIAIVPCSHFEQRAEAFSNQVVQQGAVGDDVIELQSRLQYLGFYNGKIDGVFGWGTYWALRNFQYEFGMKVDGLAGQQTKAKLVKASKYHKEHVKKNINEGKKFTHYGGTDINKQGGGTAAPKNNQSGAQGNKPSGTQGNNQGANQQGANQPAPKQQAAPSKVTAANTPNGFSQNDIQLMANAVYGEARGEPYEGQVAVAAVIINRLESATFPNTVSGVIFEPLAFTAVADGQIWLTPNETARKAVLDAINGMDPTGEATYYFNPDTATSSWIWGRPQIKKIGKHIFCK
ncbi:N-acetylmuramoyl-L-alanine amidase [Mesobacillus persicus]|uniref:Spore cortex-lytic enzyme n=2 Tax=Mesobacillus persicus TaxID=930146 RepID=A0A1H8BSK3_9BACI|nr:N-acetylmuramoyl-L-alanine amidase [Mesobacillus persicus]